MKIEKIEIEKYKVFRDFEIDFLDKDEKPLDLVVLAGINGSGKTSLFQYIEQPREDNSIQFDTKQQNKTILHLEVLDLNYHSDKLLSQHIRTFIDKLIYEDGLSAKDAYIVLQNKLDSIFSGFNLEIKLQGLNKEKKIFFINKLNEAISIDELSTGEKELLKKVFFLFVSDIKDGIILIDEPEISMHPSWQNKIVKIYKNFAKMNNCQIIIATHSPQIIASTPNESLRLLVKEDDKIKAISPNAYGMEFSKVLTDIMGVNELRDIEVQQKYDEVKSQILTDNYKTEKFEKDLLELEKMMENDSLDFGLLKLELLKREKQNASS